MGQWPDPDNIRRGRSRAVITHQQILKGAIISDLINAVTSGPIQLYLLRDHASVPLTVNGITNGTHTVFGSAPLAVSLAMILTVIGYLTHKETKRPFWPDVSWLTVKHGMFALGGIITGVVIWQRVFGSISVSLLPAALILGVVAGLTATVVNDMTIKESKLA